MSEQPNKHNWFYRFDGFIKRFIPNFNVRAILYVSILFAVVVFLQVWRISAPAPASSSKPQAKETVIADNTYWQSQEYKSKIQNQTVESFSNELQQWLDGKNQEFVRRKFEDILFINNGLTPIAGGDLTVVVPQNFNYLENFGLTRYQYAKTHGFLAANPTLVKLGTLVCDLDDKTEKATGIDLYDWRYASMPKLAQFMGTNPDWKVQIGDKILDVRDPLLENKSLLKNLNAQTQPAGLFSFLVFHDPQGNRIYLADTNILETNGVDAKLTLARISGHWSNMPKLYFQQGFEGCKEINNLSQINYGNSD